MTYSHTESTAIAEPAREEGYTMRATIHQMSLHMRRKRDLLKEGLHETVGQRLARLRQERGVTQAELAKMLKVTQTNVSGYERGRLRLHADIIIELTRILKVSADELLGTGPSTGRATKDVRRFSHRLALVEALPRRDKDALSRMLNAMLARQQTRE